MNYILAFLEGIITFISPCILPMLPVYISYFAGTKSENGEKSDKSILINALGFVSGFTLIFTLLGAFAGQVGYLLQNYQQAFNIICGIILILFGLNFTGIIRLPFINNTKQMNMKKKKMDGFFSSMLFGIVFSISWTPCVGTFLGSALMLAASTGENLTGVIMLIIYSLGLGIPFIISAVFIDKLEKVFSSIKKHYKTITIVSGALLIVLGIMIATGLMNYIYGLL